jgi:hypothetical protein
MLRISSTAPVSLIGLRSRYNEHADFLMATTIQVKQMTPIMFDYFINRIQG